MNLNLLDDKELINAYLAGNDAAFATLLNRHKARLFTAIYLLVKDRHTAEDLFQELFIKIINTMRSHKYNDEGKFLPWAMRISHNMVIDYFRRENRSPLVFSEDGTDPLTPSDYTEASAEDKILASQQRNDIRGMIQRLPHHQKEVLLMRQYGEMSFKDIAEVTGVSINTALGRMRYALSNLKKMMSERETVLE